MQLQVRLGNTDLISLVDSGSAHNFVRDDVIKGIGITLTPRSNLKVVVANGERVPSDGVARQHILQIDGEVFQDDFYALSLDGFDIILGTQWLRTLGTILLDFHTLTMVFWRSNHQVLWHGIPATSQPHAHSVVGIDLMTMLSALKDVFDKPKGLPTARRCDHRILLLPGTQPHKRENLKGSAKRCSHRDYP
jgi:hypothetical protein